MASADKQEQPAPLSKLKVFISYARRDLEFADRLVAALEARNIDVLIDRRDLPLLEEWQKELLGFIRQADAVVYIVSPHSIGSTWCTWEIAQVATLNKRLAPVIYQAVPPDAQIPEEIGKINFLSFIPPNEFASEADKLVHALGTDIGWVKEHTRLGELARRWHEKRRPTRLLLPSGDLEDAEKWAISRPREAPRATDLHLAYIQASRQGATRRQRTWIGGSLLVAAIAMGLSGVAILQRNQAKQQAERAQRVLDQVVASANRRVVALNERKQVSKRQQAERLVEPVNTAAKPQEVLDAARARIADSADQLSAEDASGSEQSARKALAMLDANAAAAPDQIAWQLARSQALERLALASERLKRRDKSLTEVAASLDISEKLAARAPKTPELQQRLAEVLSAKGDIHVKLKQYDEADRLYRRAIDIRRALSDAGSDADAKRLLAAAMLRLARLHLDREQTDQALKSTQAALAKLDELQNAGVADAELKRHLSIAYHLMADLARAAKNSREALAWAEKDIAVAAALAEANPSNLLWQHDLAIGYDKLGRTLAELERPQEAHRAYQNAIRIGDAMSARAQRRPEWQRDTAATLVKDGELLSSIGRSGEAVVAFRRALGLREQLAATQEEPFWQRELEDGYRRTRDILLRSGRAAEALETAEQQLLATSVASDAEADKAERVARALGSLCWTALFAQNVPRAVWAGQSATALMPDLSFARLNYAHALMYAGDESGARKIYLEGANSKNPAHEAWRANVRKDFAELSGRGLGHPQMAEIEREMGD